MRNEVFPSDLERTKLHNEIISRWAKVPSPSQWTMELIDQALTDYRFLLGEIAWLEYHNPDKPILAILQETARKLHWSLHQGNPDRSSLPWFKLMVYGVPAIFQRHTTIFKIVCTIFLFGIFFGMTATLLDDWLAFQVLPPETIHMLKQGRTWLDDPSSFPPPDLMSFLIIFNNTHVAIYLYATGIFWGIGTFMILWKNVILLGVLIALGIKYGALYTLLRFIFAHGVLEISGLLIEATTGFILAAALIHPGMLPRRTNLKILGLESFYLFLGTLPWILLAGFLEGYISPRYFTFDITTRVLIGILAAALLWLYLWRPLPPYWKSWRPTMDKELPYPVFSQNPDISLNSFVR